MYSYQPEERGGAIAFEGDKSMLAWFNQYLIIVGRENKRAESVSRVNTVTVYDTRNKFIAFAAGFEMVNQIICEWGSLFILQNDGKVSPKNGYPSLPPPLWSICVLGV